MMTMMMIIDQYRGGKYHGNDDGYRHKGGRYYDNDDDDYDYRRRSRKYDMGMGIVVADMVEITDEGEASMTTGTREEDIISDDD